MSHEHRRKDRKSVSYDARLFVDETGQTDPCHIVDISDHGARLLVPNSQAAPERFTLLISQDGRVYRHCEVVWRSDGQLGVRFVPGPPPRLRPSESPENLFEID